MVDDDTEIDERNAALILRRAAQLQEQQSDQAQVADGGRSFRLRELEEAVAELGIDPALVRTAADELSIAEVRNQAPWFLGGKTDLLFEATVEGPIEGQRLESMLEVLRRYLGSPGELRTSGSAQIWQTSKGTNRSIFMTLTPRGKKTLVRLEEAMPVDSRATVGGSAAAGTMAGLLTIASLKALLGTAAKIWIGPLMVIGALIGWLIGRQIWARMSARREEQVRRAFKDILRAAAHEQAALPAADEG